MQTPISRPTSASPPEPGTPENPSRTLIHIPIIHNQADMGALGKIIKQMTIEKRGPQSWERNVNSIQQMWTQIETAIDSWPLPFPKVRVYQDALPICGRELQIVTELAQAGSRNHQLLLRLREKGATIMGTEPAELLVQEYKFVKQLLEPALRPAANPMTADSAALSHSLLRQRDRAIGQRINRTLQRGETGLLFLGMLHSLRGLLDADIKVDYCISLYYSK